MPKIEGAGRKPILDKPTKLQQLRDLCALQCTYAEIAAVFHVDKTTVERWAQKPQYRRVMDEGRQEGLISLRRAQFDLAKNGNATMCVWLGKQLLGQKDEVTNILGGAVTIHDESAREQIISRLVGALPKHSRGDQGSAEQPLGG